MQTGSITLEAPAKINLYLDIISKRKDLYHNIATIFCKLKLCDHIRVSAKGKGVSLACNHPQLRDKRSNLAYKAALFMKDNYRLEQGLDISIKKNIPIAAGLGGGSSDAAAVIKAVNELFNLHLTRHELMLSAKHIGADVGFFLSGHDYAIGRGIGDRLTGIEGPAARFYVLLLVPDLHIYTKSIYSALSLRLTKPRADVNISSRILMRSDWLDRLPGFLYNRLEDVVLPLYPVTGAGRQALCRYTDNVLLSGSGPTLFGIFKTKEQAHKAARGLAKYKKWQIFLTQNA
ncbi:MAG: 4-(cytidine 5'-diphospho)-2-C-methyl-D-erythritol kinase [Candidatus Omnitrophica bacterium]|nr:4-(cytidine 5'-diphospho)-2-C-methyl-D-erythritol kinase [Candidatus Omnitrophota bacterium]